MTLASLTLWRPWPNAIISAGKRIENRDYPPPAKLVGELLALHAGKHYEDLSVSDWPFPGDWQPPAESECPLGVVAVARVVGVVTPLGLMTWQSGTPTAGSTFDMAWWARGAYGWVLDDVRALASPVPCNGHQRVWTLPDDVERAVRVQLEAT